MYKFRSKADADLIMTQPVGDQILRIIGKEPAAQGIVEAGAVAAAIAALEQAVAADDAARRASGNNLDEEDRVDGGAIAIGLQQRAWPMLEMMRRSVAERADIVWGV
jgi:hypothetical protein